MRRLIGNMAMCVLIVVLCAPAMAAIQSGNVFELNWPDWPSSTPRGSEGPFHMIPRAGGADVNYYTFCVETTEYFSPGSWYQVGKTVPGGISGGINTASVRTGRDLTGYTAWIYSMYRGWDGWHLPSAFNVMSTDLYNALQYAVWAGMVTKGGAVGDSHAEQQIGPASSYLGRGWTEVDLEGLGIGYSNFLDSTWGGPGTVPGTIGETTKLACLGSVRVLNLYGWDSATGTYDLPAQDQLGVVPEPLSVLVWSLLGSCSFGFGAYRWYRRK